MRSTSSWGRVAWSRGVHHEAGTILTVGAGTLLHPAVPRPAGSLVYELLTGHPERERGELVFVADLTNELRLWPQDT